MRWATVLCKVSAQNVEATSLADVLEAATVGGANALRRSDIGRLAVGAKADLSLIDLAHPSLQPLHDPLKSLVFSGLDRAITDVFVGGEQVVAGGVVKTIDVTAVAEVLNRGQQKALKGVASGDYAKRSAEQVFPLSLGVREG